MWLSELHGRLGQLLKEHGDVRVVKKIKGYVSSNFEENYTDVESESFFIVHRTVYDKDGGTLLKESKHLEITNLY